MPIAAGSTLPPHETIDATAARAGLDTVIAANPMVDYPAVIIEECPFGSIEKIAAAVGEFVALDPELLYSTQHAWVNPEPPGGAGCWIADTPPEAGQGADTIYGVEVYARVLGEGGHDPESGRNDLWRLEFRFESELWRGGELVTFCWVGTEQHNADDRDCVAHWVSESAGIVVELEVWTTDAIITPLDVGATMQAILPDLTENLAANAASSRSSATGPSEGFLPGV